MKSLKNISKILTLTIILLSIGCLNSFGQESSSKRIKVGISVTPDIYNPTVKFYVRTSNEGRVTNWKLVSTKSIAKKDRGRAAVYSQYYTVTKTSFIEIKAIVSHPKYRDCDTGAKRFDYNSRGGVKIWEGDCCMMHAKYRK